MAIILTKKQMESAISILREEMEAGFVALTEDMVGESEKSEASIASLRADVQELTRSLRAARKSVAALSAAQGRILRSLKGVDSGSGFKAR